MRQSRHARAHALLQILLCSALLWLMSANVHASNTLVITQTDFVLAGATPPPSNANWQPQPLPDQWRQTRPGIAGDGWYRAQFNIDSIPTESWSVYLPRLCMNAAVYVNGILLGDGGRFEEPMSRNWNRPLLFTIPPTLLHTGTNTLLIRIRAPAMVQGSLPPVEIGAESVIKPDYQQQFFERITINQALTLIIGMVGILILSLWWRRRSDSMYGYFGASALVWALNSTNLHIQQAPFSTRYWEILINASFQWFVPLLLVSLLRFLGKRHRVLETILWITAVSAPTSMLFMPDAMLLPTFLFWHSITLACCVASLFVLIPAAIKQRTHESRLLLIALLINLGFGAHDWLVHSKLLPPLLGTETRIHLLHFGAPVFFLMVGWIMTSRFVGALNRLENVNVELEQRVAAKTVELEDNFRHLQQLRSEQAVLEERERIYRDLHDDIGAKLLQLVYRSENNNADLARSALQDLRDVVSHPGGSALTMADLLADWRAETDQRLSAANINLHWQQPESLNIDFLQPHAINLGRILREAISNAIRHAKPTSVRVSLSASEHQFVLKISDDGQGFDATTHKPGRGVNNMQLRARRIGGDISWSNSTDGGCVVQLTVGASDRDR